MARCCADPSLGRWDNAAVTEDELLRRLDRTIQRNSAVIELNGRAFERMVRSLGRLEAAVGRLEASIEDLRYQVAASTNATLRLLDRLGPEPGRGT
jgi:hypothetical protein